MQNGHKPPLKLTFYGYDNMEPMLYKPLRKQNYNQQTFPQYFF